MIQRLTVALALSPAAALAHGGPQGHAHPHGAEVLILGAAAAVAAALLLRRARR